LLTAIPTVIKRAVEISALPYPIRGTDSRNITSKERAMAHFRPLQDRILVRRIEAEEKTPGGIIIPDTAKEKPVEGEVLAVGPGARDETGTLRPLDVKVGDRVLFGKWAGTEVLINGEDRLILKESDILGVIEDDAQARAKAA
jgi:chaperonin GroES